MTWLKCNNSTSKWHDLFKLSFPLSVLFCFYVHWGQLALSFVVGQILMFEVDMQIVMQNNYDLTFVVNCQNDGQYHFFQLQLSQLKTELAQFGISLAEFADKVLGDVELSGSVLTHPPRLLDELDSQILPKFLLIQQWLCQPKENKLNPFRPW